MSDLTADNWWACPACGNAARGKDNPAAIRGSSRPTRFADGAKGLAIQAAAWSLTCPCGHTWQVEETHTRQSHRSGWETTWAPYTPPPPPTPEEQAQRERIQPLRQRRVHAGVFMREVARRLGMDVAAFSRLERFGTDDEALLARWDAALRELEMAANQVGKEHQ